MTQPTPDDMQAFLDLVLPIEGAPAGYVAMASAYEAPTRAAQIFTQQFFARTDHARMIAYAHEQAGYNRHVWINSATLFRLGPTPTEGRKRADVLSTTNSWADVDREVPDDERKAWIDDGFTLVESGTPGRLHVYALLSETVDPDTAAALNCRLVRCLRSPDTSKDGPESLLRIPGVPNRKAGAGMVRLIHAGKRWTVVELEAWLDAHPAPEPTGGVRNASGEYVAGEKDWLTAPVIPFGCRYDWLVSYAGWLRVHTRDLGEAERMMRLRWTACEQPEGRYMPVDLADRNPQRVGETDTATGILHRIWTWKGYESPSEKDEAMAAAFGIQPPAGQIPSPVAGPPAVAPQGVAALPRTRHVVLTRASEITPRPVRWLWQDRLPVGSLALFAGREGVGKSTACYTLAADISRGRLPGVYHGQPRDVVIVASEDSWEFTIVPRLMAAGADLGRIHRASVQSSLDLNTGLDLPVDIPALREQLQTVETAMLLLDPLMSRLNATLDTHKDADVRRALEPIVSLADEADVAVIGLIHVNKSSSTDALNSVMGSRAFTAVARSVLYALTDPHDETGRRRLLAQAKNNLGRSDLPTLGYVIDPVTVAETEQGAVTTGQLRWVAPEQVGQETLSALLEAGQKSGDAAGTALDRAAGWLVAYLHEHGHRATSREIIAAGYKQARHAERTLRRARDHIEAASERLPVSPPVVEWVLSPDDCEVCKDPTSIMAESPGMGIADKTQEDSTNTDNRNAAKSGESWPLGRDDIQGGVIYTHTHGLTSNSAKSEVGRINTAKLPAKSETPRARAREPKCGCPQPYGLHEPDCGIYDRAAGKPKAPKRKPTGTRQSSALPQFTPEQTAYLERLKNGPTLGTPNQDQQPEPS